MNSLQLGDSLFFFFISGQEPHSPKVKQLHSSEVALQAAKLAHALNVLLKHIAHTPCGPQRL